MSGSLVMKDPKLSRAVFVVTIVFLLLPLFILVLYSFNGGKNSWTGFSFRWYRILFSRKPVLWSAFAHSIIVAISSAFIASVIGSAAAISLNWYKYKLRPYVRAITFVPLVMPEIIVGLSLALLFSSAKLNLGLGNVILAHVSFCIPFVTLMVLARLEEFDGAILEAADDLGANEWQKLTRVILPMSIPGIAAGFVTAVTLSLEDFVITVFVGTMGSVTLPVAINNTIRRDPDSNVVYALSVILIAGTVLVAICAKRFLRYLVKR